jgi:hypothetical protein
MRRLFKGQFDITLILPVFIGLLYAGTGNWSAERWNGALAIMGLGAAAKSGYEKGYNTLNPDLHPQQQGRPRDEHGRFIKLDEDRGR